MFQNVAEQSKALADVIDKANAGELTDAEYDKALKDHWKTPVMPCLAQTTEPAYGPEMGPVIMLCNRPAGHAPSIGHQLAWSWEA